MNIVVRPFQTEDKKTIERMHASMGFNYAQPDWGKMLLSAVVEIDGKPAMATFLRKTAETFLVMDAAGWRKRDHLANLLITHRELVKPMQTLGLTDTHAWLPPEIEKNFGKLLLHIGWKKQLWNSYCFEVK